MNLTNNLFKLLLVGSKANSRVVLALGVPAIPGALAGAWLLTYLSDLPQLASYDLFGRAASVTGVNLVVALLIAGFALLELTSAGGRLAENDRRWDDGIAKEKTHSQEDAAISDTGQGGDTEIGPELGPARAGKEGGNSGPIELPEHGPPL